jgi:hypothetical protein
MNKNLKRAQLKIENLHREIGGGFLFPRIFTPYTVEKREEIDIQTKCSFLGKN